jgi:ABC-type sugar transport system, periplasmic component
MSKPSARKGLFGLVLVVVFFGLSAWHVLFRTDGGGPDGEGDRITIRIGHWLMHAGMRESFDEAIREYERLHPDVRIEQIPVPLRTWSAWVRTQLTGGTAPDITGQLGLDEAMLSRHFLPLDRRLDEPNPHNQGGPLEGVPWRDTFTDGLASLRALNPNSGEIFGVYLQLNSLRLFYNKRLLRLVTGSDRPPSTYAELRALRAQTDHYNAAHGTALAPIAGCGPYAQYLFQRLLASQTQKLTIELSPTRNLQLPPVDLATLVLEGRLGYHTPELRSALALQRDLSSLMTPGFTQLQRDDALFTYLQQNAVAIVAGTWDYAVFVRDGDFETGIVPIPYPDRDDPDFGQHVLGVAAEGAGGPEAMLGVVRNSPHPEIALDFLRFLSSHRIATRFTELSKRISGIAEVAPPGDAPGLAPQLHGEVPGFGVDFQNFGAGHAYTLFQRRLHTLIGPRGGVDAFVEEINKDLPEALRRDMAAHAARARRDIQGLDARLGIMLSHPGNSIDPDEIERLHEARILRHTDRLRRRDHAEP